MDRLNKLQKWAQETYSPKEAAWKRPVLLTISLIIIISCAIAGYTQINFHWANNGVWLVIVMFSILSITGLFISIKCKDFWVALVLGGV